MSKEDKKCRRMICEDCFYEFSYTASDMKNNNNYRYIECPKCKKIYKETEDLETVLKELERLQEDYIEKDQIRKKIEENNKLIEECREDEEHCGEIYLYEHANKILEELLEEK